MLIAAGCGKEQARAADIPVKPVRHATPPILPQSQGIVLPSKRRRKALAEQRVPENFLQDQVEQEPSADRTFRGEVVTVRPTAEGNR